MRTPSSKIFSRAFTLIEVVLALGVVSTALVSLLGLMALAFTMLRESIRTTTYTQIVQSLASEVAMQDFSEIDTYYAGVGHLRYYDDEGQTEKSAAKAIYKAELSVKDAMVPGQTDTKPDPDAKKIVIEISSALSQGRNNPQNPPKTFSVWAVNNGR